MGRTVSENYPLETINAIELGNPDIFPGARVLQAVLGTFCKAYRQLLNGDITGTERRGCARSS